MNARMVSSLITAALLQTAASTPGHSASPAANTKYDAEVSGTVEEVFVNRTVRSAHTREPTPACAAAPFPVVTEDVYDLWSLATDGKTSRIVDSHVAPLGSFRACFGQPAQGKPLPMYASFSYSGLTFTGVGECLGTTAQPPVRTVLALNCSLKLGDLPAEYAGGLGVSSSLAPALGRDQPADAYVPGYLSTSVIVIRLWKAPK